MLTIATELREGAEYLSQVATFHPDSILHIEATGTAFSDEWEAVAKFEKPWKLGELSRDEAILFLLFVAEFEETDGDAQ